MFLPSDLPSWLALLLVPLPMFVAGVTWSATEQSKRISTIVSAALAAARRRRSAWASMKRNSRGS